MGCIVTARDSAEGHWTKMGMDHDNHFAWTRGDKAVSVYVEPSGIDSVHSRWILWPLPVVSNIELFAFAGEQQSLLRSSAYVSLLPFPPDRRCVFCA